MADKSIVELGVAQQMTDDALLPVYQGGETRSIEGALIKQYARDSVKVYTDAAREHADAAEASKNAAAGFAAKAEENADRTAADVLVVKSAADAERERVAEEDIRKTAEASRETEEGKRAAAERDRATSETARREAEEGRRTAEQTRVDNETARGVSEADRAAKEAQRVKDETARKGAETKRANAETGRATAETGRETAEADRVEKEAGRAAEEGKRATAERTRDTNEEKRRTAEIDRAAKEAERRTAEEQRVSGETARTESEADRQAKETARQQTEAGRVTAEKGRVDAETLRGQGEQARGAAETLRMNAEAERATAETGRTQAEQGRVGSETQRTAAERTRAEQETRREAGEAARNVWEAYDPAKTYQPLNKVAYNGSSYICTAASTGNAPTDTAHWLMIAAKGKDGEGAGDMTASVYDPQGKSQDVFAYTDTSIAGLPVKRLTNSAESPVDLDTLIEPGVYFFDGDEVRTYVQGEEGTEPIVLPYLVVSVYNPVVEQSCLAATAGLTGVISRSQINERWGAFSKSISPSLNLDTMQFSKKYIPDLTASDVGALSSTGGTLTGPLTMSGNKVTGVGAPTANNDAATKGYTDAGLAGKSDTGHTHTAGQVSFTDGETFQQKLDAGKLTGKDGAPGKDGKDGATGATGKTGATGPQGPQGTPTTVNGKTGTSITLTAADVGAVSKEYVDEKVAGVGGKRVAHFTVGTSTSGWTAADCDYLCDGTDDQVEINAAIQALPATGGEVVILDGTYNITASIAVNKANTKLSGNGMATVLNGMRINSTGVDIVRVTADRCTITGLTVDKSNAEHGHGIYLLASNNCTVTGILCSNCYDGIGVYESSGSTVMWNKCENNYDIAIYIADSSNIIVVGNTCNGNRCGMYLTGVSNVTIIGNTCLNNSSYGIELVESFNNTITGNTCNNNSAGIILCEGCTNNVMTGNTCIRGAGMGSDYTGSQATIVAVGAGCSCNLFVGNNIMGKEYIDGGDGGNTFINNKYSEYI